MPSSDVASRNRCSIEASEDEVWRRRLCAAVLVDRELIKTYIEN